MIKNNDYVMPPLKVKYIDDLSCLEKEDIKNLYKDGSKIKIISKKYNLSETTICRFLEKENVKLTRRIVKNKKHKNDFLREIPFTDEQKHALVGTVLGDGCLARDNEKSYYKLSLGQCIKQKGYFDYKVKLFSPFILSPRISIDRRGNSTMCQGGTIIHPDIDKFGKLFYENKVKVIKPWIEEYLSPISLAMWILDDGNLHGGVNIRLATMSFTKEENDMLAGMLKRVFDLDCKVKESINTNSKKLQTMLYFNKENTEKISNLIRPFTVECMRYKLMPLLND